jgi:hypothetical protein
VQRSTIVLLWMALLLPPVQAAEKGSRWRAVWHVSQVLLAGAETADIASSWGKSEANPLLRTGPRFAYGSASIKLGVLAGSLAAQHFVVRKYPQAAPYFAASNLGATAALSAVAARNLGVKH